MKKTILFSFLSLLIFSFSVFAQNEEGRYASTRLDDLVNQLKRQTVDLADQTSEDVRRRSFNSRSDLEAAFLAQQLDASAGFFQQMYRDGRRASELRDAASIMTDLARRAPNFGSNSGMWRSVQNTINDINRELGNSGGGGNQGGGNQGNVLGRVFWRGTVDSKVYLEIQGNSLKVVTMEGQAYPDGVFSFTNPLPRRNVSVNVNKVRGRGEVRVIQQPNRDNNYTTLIEITDREGGAREYQVEVFWR